MATYTTSLHDDGSAAAKKLIHADTLYDRFTVATALAINDVIRGRYIPKGVVLLDGWVTCEELDTGVDAITLTYRINDGTTQKNFFAASTVGQAGGLQRADVASQNAVGYEVTAAGFYLEILVAAGPGTGATDVEVEMFVKYTPDLIPDDV